jgi:hypothetical protein
MEGLRNLYQGVPSHAQPDGALHSGSLLQFGLSPDISGLRDHGVTAAAMGDQS